MVEKQSAPMGKGLKAKFGEIGGFGNILIK